MSSFGSWVKAARLRTLPLSFSVILVGNFSVYNYIGIKEGELVLPPKEFNWGVLGLALLTTLFLQILSNFANDYGDAKKGADNAERVGPDRAIQSGEISSKAMFRAIVLFGVLSFISGLSLLLVAFGSSLNWTLIGFILLGLAAIAAAIKYTMGKGAYGYSAMGDLFVFIFFGLVGVMGSAFVQAGEFVWYTIFPAMIIGCFSVAVLNLNNMRDIVNDKAVGKTTLAVLLGSKGAKVYHYILFVLAYGSLSVLIIWGKESFQLLGLLSIPVIILHLTHLIKVSKVKTPKEFDPMLKVIALSTFVFSIIFSCTLYFA